MPHVARITHRATHQFILAAVGALLFTAGGAAVAPAHAQSAYESSQPSVTVDYSVLDRLGPAPQVPDSRFVLRVPTRPNARRVASRHSDRRHPRVVAQRGTNHSAHRLVQAHPVRHIQTAQVVQVGAVTIDYRALPSPAIAAGPRIVLRRPGTATVAAAMPTVERPEAPLTPLAKVASAAPQAVVLAAPSPRPAPSPTPIVPPQPRVATAPAVQEPRPAPRAELPELSSLLPIGGVALAATRSPTEPVAGRNVPQSDSRTIRFAPGVAELQGDAPGVLDALAQTLKAKPSQRIALVAYASGDADQAIEARRVSLARAVAVRAYLIQHGVASTRIDVRALGNRVTDGGSADRVDLVTTGR